MVETLQYPKVAMSTPSRQPVSLPIHMDEAMMFVNLL
jgi:hypothetical protein